MTEQKLMSIGFYLEEMMGSGMYCIYKSHQIVPIEEIEAALDKYYAEAKAFFQKYKQPKSERIDCI
jgi:hypothetical protein